MEETPRPVPGQPLSKQPRKVADADVKQQIQAILKEVALGAPVEVSSHFKMRAAQRGFRTTQAIGILKRGQIISEPEFCPEFCNWKFSVTGEHDDGTLVVVAAVSAGDLGRAWSHNVSLITGYIR